MGKDPELAQPGMVVGAPAGQSPQHALRFLDPPVVDRRVPLADQAVLVELARADLPDQTSDADPGGSR